MFLIFFLSWIIFNGQITTEILIFGVIIAAAVFWFVCKFMDYSLKKELKLYRSIGFFLWYFLVLLKEKKSMNGIEIADQMKLAPSTVSHHMTHLKNSGLVHEEPAGNTKYYSINVHCMKNCIETLEKTFL